jgi:hypothetical protein
MIMNFIPGLSLRSSEEDEIMGIDDAEIGEFAVSFFCSHKPIRTLITDKKITV